MGVGTREENTMTPDQIAAMRALAGQIRDGERIAHGVPTRVYDLANAVLALLAERVDVELLRQERNAAIDRIAQIAVELDALHAEVARLTAERDEAIATKMRAILHSTFKGYMAGENVDAKHWREHAEHAEARVASLEAALRHIAEHDNVRDEGQRPPRPPLAVALEQWDICIKTAKAALAAGGTE